LTQIVNVQTISLDPDNGRSGPTGVPRRIVYVANLALSGLTARADDSPLRTYVAHCPSRFALRGCAPIFPIHSKEKDLGLTEFYLVGMLRQIEKCTQLPKMVKPLELKTLQAFYARLAQRLMSSLNPQR